MLTNSPDVLALVASRLDSAADKASFAAACKATLDASRSRSRDWWQASQLVISAPDEAAAKAVADSLERFFARRGDGGRCIVVDTLHLDVPLDVPDDEDDRPTPSDLVMELALKHIEARRYVTELHPPILWLLPATTEELDMRFPPDLSSGYSDVEDGDDDGDDDSDDDGMVPFMCLDDLGRLTALTSLEVSGRVDLEEVVVPPSLRRLSIGYDVFVKDPPSMLAAPLEDLTWISRWRTPNFEETAAALERMTTLRRLHTMTRTWSFDGEGGLPLCRLPHSLEHLGVPAFHGYLKVPNDDSWITSVKDTMDLTRLPNLRSVVLNGSVDIGHGDDDAAALHAQLACLRRVTSMTLATDHDLSDFEGLDTWAIGADEGVPLSRVFTGVRHLVLDTGGSIETEKLPPTVETLVVHNESDVWFTSLCPRHKTVEFTAPSALPLLKTLELHCCDVTGFRPTDLPALTRLTLDECTHEGEPITPARLPPALTAFSGVLTIV